MRVGRRLAKVDEQLEAVDLINTVRSIYGLSYRELSQYSIYPRAYSVGMQMVIYYRH